MASGSERLSVLCQRYANIKGEETMISISLLTSKNLSRFNRGSDAQGSQPIAGSS